MMKKQCVKAVIIVGSLFFFFASNVQAQVDSVKAVKLKAQLIDTICKCVTQSDTGSIKTADQAQGLLMKCFMGSGMGVFMDYTSAAGVDMSDMAAMQELAKKVGIELTTSCPAMLKLAMKVAETDDYKKLMQGDSAAPKAADKSSAPAINKN